MTQTNRLEISYLAPAQALKHITINEGFRKFDRLSQISVAARNVAIQPSQPNDGEGYILPANAVGENWDYAAENDLAFFDQGWQILTPKDGFQAWVESEQAGLVFSQGNWISPPLPSSNHLGVNTQADDVNRLSVKSDAELLSHDDVTPGSGDARKVINKKSVAHTASILLQSNYQGKTELGLLGDDAFSIHTSSDGSAFNTSLRVSLEEDRVDLYHPLRVNGSEVLSNSDKPAFVGNIESAANSYTDDSLIDLTASLDSHNAYDRTKNAFVAPFSGIYYVQVGAVIRSVSSGVTIVRLRAYKNENVGQSVSAVTADANITTVNDASLLQLQAGDEITLRTTFNGLDGTVQFFPSSRLLIYRII